ncbi:hypothetical protein LXL04_022289 [Taraxacum kok-saghyz]
MLYGCLMMKTIAIAASNLPTKFSKCFHFRAAFYSNSTESARNIIGCSNKYSSLPGNIALGDALLVFDEMLQRRPLPSVENFNKLLSSLVKSKHYTTALSMVRRLGLLGFNPLVKPDIYSFHIAINCFRHLDRVCFGFSVVGNVMKLGYEPNCHVFNTLIWGLCNDGKLYQAVTFFDQIVKNGFEPNVVTYNTLINGLCKFGKPSSAMILLKKMERSRACKPDIVAYNTLIDGLCKNEQVTDALNLFYEMIRKGIAPDVITYTCLIQGVCDFEQWDKAKRLLDDMFSQNIPRDIQTYNILVDALCKVGKASEAHHMFASMIKEGASPDTVTYNTLMDGYCLVNRVDKARNLLDYMMSRNCAPSVRTYSSLINGYCKSKRLDEALSLFKGMSKNGIGPDVVTYTTLISGLCHDGRFKDAMMLFDEMKTCGLEADIVTYSTLVDSLCKHKRVKEALEMFAKIDGVGLAPDIVACNCLIDGLCKDEKLEAANNNFKKQFRGEFFSKKLWDAANTYLPASHDILLNEISDVSQAAIKYLNNNHKKVWSKSKFGTTSKCDYNTNNISESFNSWIGALRYQPVLDLLDGVREKLIKRFDKKRMLVKKWNGVLVPIAKNHLEDISKNLGEYEVSRCSDNHAEVKCKGKRWEVNLYERKCSCRVWQVTGLPCVHASAFIAFTRDVNWDKYVDSCYTVQKVKEAYAFEIAPMPGADQWMQKEWEKIYPPIIKRPVGRPKKKRIKSSGESKRRHKCPRCGEYGHREKTCKNPAPQDLNASQTSTSKRRSKCPR